MVYSLVRVFFFEQKTAYEVRISDWSSDVCSSDLDDGARVALVPLHLAGHRYLHDVADLGRAPDLAHQSDLADPEGRLHAGRHHRDQRCRGAQPEPATAEGAHEGDGDGAAPLRAGAPPASGPAQNDRG